MKTQFLSNLWYTYFFIELVQKLDIFREQVHLKNTSLKLMTIMVDLDR